MIYGEEVFPVRFNKGLWHTAFNPLPDGYCSKLENLVINQNGFAELRGSFKEFSSPITLSGLNTFGTAANTPGVDGISYATQTDTFAFLGADVTNGLALVSNIAGGFPKIWLSKRTSAGQVNSYSPAAFSTYSYVPKAMALYRDRLYGWYNANIQRYSGWDFGTSAATPTVNVYAAMPGTAQELFFFKDRLFGINTSGRVFFTDAIAAGGYPETWNFATNFFDLPTDADYVIYGKAILNNLIYFFTGSGVFTLQVLGLPTNWILKRLDETIRVQDPNYMCVNNGIVYYTDRISVFAYNGYKRVDISEPLKEVISNYQGIGLHPFEDGFLLTLQTFIPRPSIGGTTYTVALSDSRIFYFNGETWSELTFNTTLKMSVVQSAPLRYLAYTGNIPKSLVRFMGIDVENDDLYYMFMYYNSKDYSGDQMFGNTVAVLPKLETQLSLGKPDNSKRIRYGYIDAYIDNTNLIIQKGIDGAAVSNPETKTITTETDDENYYMKSMMPQYNRRLAIELTSDNTPSAGPNAGVPVVASSASNAVVATADITVTMPASVAVGDLLIAFVVNDLPGGIVQTLVEVSSPGWEQIHRRTDTEVGFGLYAKIATASNNLLVTAAATDKVAACARITGHGVTDVTTDLLAPPFNGSTIPDNAPRPPIVVGLPVGDYLALECFGADDDDDTATYWSTGYTGLQQRESAASATSCLIALASKACADVTQELPGPMALALLEEYIVSLVLVPGAGAGVTAFPDNPPVVYKGIDLVGNTGRNEIDTLNG